MKIPCLMLLGAFATGSAGGAELSALQTAMHIAQDEMERAMKERDADARRVSVGEKELERLKLQLEADRKKATQSANRYLESKKKYDKAQSALDKAWKK
ncbi:MAG: hypothetical protein FD134_1256 [Gallionellaceae bacterium]|nr:MAG: hypothetical protein FD134_1256 [Gallionellaceae bacterium]